VTSHACAASMPLGPTTVEPSASAWCTISDTAGIAQERAVNIVRDEAERFDWVVLKFRGSGTPVSALRPSRQLVVSGPYRFSRNPDYVGQALVYTGIALVLNSVWVLLAQLPARLLIPHVVIAREERYLESRFGAEYARFCQHVRRWF